MKGEMMMDFAGIPVGFGIALAQNQAAMMCYAHLDEQSKQDILDRANNVQSEKDMYSLIASLVNGTMQ